MLNNLKALAAAALMLTLSACATQGGATPGEMEIRSGVIEQIMPTQIASSHHTGVGAVVGGVVGLGLGSLIGNGNGRDVAMVLGTIGGAFAGNEVQKKHDQPIPAQQIIVRTNQGVLVSITQPTNQALFTGAKVLIEGNGDSARVILR